MFSAPEVVAFGGAAVLVGLAVVVGGLLANPRLPGIPTGPPPWRAETAGLPALVEAIGLPAMAGQGQVQHPDQHLDAWVDGQPVLVPTDIGINRAADFRAPNAIPASYAFAPGL